MHITIFGFYKLHFGFGFDLMLPCLLFSLLLLLGSSPYSCDVPRKAHSIFLSPSLTYLHKGHAKFSKIWWHLSFSLQPCLAKHTCVGDTPSQVFGLVYNTTQLFWYMKSWSLF
jgi:hypothetical protein